jgi:hypothetical protein
MREARRAHRTTTAAAHEEPLEIILLGLAMAAAATVTYAYIGLSLLRATVAG